MEASLLSYCTHARTCSMSESRERDRHSNLITSLQESSPGI